MLFAKLQPFERESEERKMLRAFYNRHSKIMKDADLSTLYSEIHFICSTEEHQVWKLEGWNKVLDTLYSEFNARLGELRGKKIKELMA